MDGQDTAGRIDPASVSGAGLGADARALRLRAVMAAARYHGFDLDPDTFRGSAAETTPSPASLVEWVRESGLSGKATRLRWRNLMRLRDTAPIVLLFNDGSAGVLEGVNTDHNVVLLRDPRAAAGDVVAVDELRLSQIWNGEALLIRQERATAPEDQAFSLGWVLRVVLTQKKSLREIAIASLTMTFLSIIPALMIMVVIDRVVVYQSYSTLAMLSLMLAVMVIADTILGSARRILIAYVGTRLDTELNLHVFNRLLRVPLDYFEHHQAGETTYKVAQINRVREFITGRLLYVLLDGFTLIVMIPLLFWLAPTLTWFVLGGALLIMLIVLAFLHPIAVATGKVVNAEIQRNSTLIETVHGVKTVKSLVLEGPRRKEWDERVAEVGRHRLALLRLSNWPQTLVEPIQQFISFGVILIGAYFALTNSTGLQIGSLMAFMMLSRRVAQPLVSAAKLLEDFEEIRISVAKVAEVMNQPLEDAAAGGLRPVFAGALTFQDVTFTYPRTKTPALDRVTFEVPPGTMLGVVGRSGSGKSTITRLLQGITRDYSGFLKIDGADLREINLQHLRRNFGVVLQENFLFRGSIRENIISGRPGLTLEDVVRAARLAGAEEFIERMPAGYETFIEEGSPNLSGGQRQRLAIARALISDPRLLILDEATSALDPESEALVNANLLRIARGRTMVIVSHRLSSLTDCDLTLVMERGRVADIAPHNVLVERCEIYRQLWLQQNRHLDPQGARHGTPAPVLIQGD
jgi:subfamily B ATP-binding cassette protein HlyB/CyaB